MCRGQVEHRGYSQVFPRTVETLTDLTAQEAQIAKLVAPDPAALAAVVHRSIE
jgi:hypothetical protein